MKCLPAAGALVVAGLAVAAYAALAPGKLRYGDKAVSTSFITQGGKTYVALDDVANVLDCVVQKNDDGFTLAPIGKGAMVQGAEGKVGQTIGRPELQFTVEKVLEAGSHYDRQFSSGPVDAYNDNNRLVVLLIRVRNGTAKTVNICTVGGAKTALADMDEHTYEVTTGDGPRNVDILPGAVTDFGIVFSIPKSEKLKDLVYQTDGFPHVEIFRVSLRDSGGGS